jgi:murein DD-endopeptidase MepM/ murein hydrolase activator NlpD
MGPMADTPGKYSAGTIFLQVVPVFRDTMDAIRRETKDLSAAIGQDLENAGREGGKRAGKAMGEEMAKEAEKSGEESSKKYLGSFETGIKKSVASAQKELNSLSFKDAEIALTDDFKRVQKKLEKLAKVDLKVDFDEKEVLADIAIIQGSIEALTKKDHDLRFDVNLSEISKALAAVEKRALEVEKRKRELNFTPTADFTPMERRVGAFEKKFKTSMKRAADSLGDNLSREIQEIRSKLDMLADVEIGIELDSTAAVAQAAALHAQLEAIVENDISVDAEIDIAAAMSQLAMFQAAKAAVDNDIDVKVDVDAGAAIAQVGLLGAVMAAFRPHATSSASAADNAANSFRSFNFVILAAVTLLPAMIPVLGALGGALLALIPIFGAVITGIGIMVAGFSGIGAAVGELGKVQDERRFADERQARTSRSLAAALNSVRDAERSLADARRNAARAAQDAARAVADARRNAADAIESAIEQERAAEEALADAKDRVRKAEEDLLEARKRARDEAASIADKQRKAAAEERQRVLDLMDAQAQFNATNADGAATNVDKEQASINLEMAQIALNEIRDEQVELADAAADFAKNGVNGSETVQEAQERLTEAIKDQADAQEDVAEAAKNTREVQLDAARMVADALRNQRRVAVDNARAIADAERNLARARQNYHQGVADAADEATAAEKRLETAMSKLGPAGQRFARFIFGLRDEAFAFRDAIQEAMLPGVQSAINQVIKTYGERFTRFGARVGGIIGQIFRDMAKGLQGPEWKRFFNVMGDLIPRLLKQGAKGTGNWLTAFANMMVVAAPFAERLSRAMLHVSRDVRKFFAAGKGKNALNDFLEYAARVGPKVASFIGALVSAFVAIGKALAPLGEHILEALTGLFRFISDMDTGLLRAIATAVIGIVIAFQVAVGVVAIFLAGSAIFASTVGSIIFVLIALGTAVYLAYQRFEVFRKIVDHVAEGFVTMWKLIWTVAKVVFKGIAWFISNVVLPAIRGFGKIVRWLWEGVLRPVLGFIREKFMWLAKAIKWVWDNFYFPIIDMFIKIVQKLWEKVISPILGWIRDKFVWLGEKMNEGYKKFIKPVFDKFVELVEKHVVPKFERAIEAIKAIWDGLKNILAEPVKFLIEKVINEGIIGAFNWVARKVGSKEMGTVPVPGWVDENSHAQGTASVLPGYTPGRDTHTFYSPTAGRLNLSGGEAIMRPEFSAALGKSGVDYLNNVAKRGPGALRNLFGGGQAFARGGVFWPVPGRSTGTYPGHDGVDINRGSGWDDLNDPIWAAHTGTVTYVGTAHGYGNAIWIKGTDGFTTLYGHTNMQFVSPGAQVRAGQLIGRVGNTGNSSAPHLHFGVYPGGTYGAAMAYLTGAEMPRSDGGGGFNFGIPGWVKDILGGPVKWLRDRIRGPLDKLGDFGDNPYMDIITAVPEKLMTSVGGEIKDIVGGVFGGVRDAVGGVVGGALDTVGLKDGGILPYNGTMKYDSGGYLPTGLTSVVNLTGKPEPVFTSSQFDRMRDGGDDGGFTYAPTFNQSDLTAEDVAEDLDFTIRRVRRGGRYEASKS